MIEGLSLLLAAQLAGEILAHSLALPVPGPVLGLILLTGVLRISSRLLALLQPPAAALHAHLSLMFVPAGVGVMLYLRELAAQWLLLAATVVTSALIGLAVSAFVLHRLTRDTAQRP